MKRPPSNRRSWKYSQDYYRQNVIFVKTLYFVVFVYMAQLYKTKAALIFKRKGKAIVVALGDCEPPLETKLQNDPYLVLLKDKKDFHLMTLQRIQAYRKAHYEETISFQIGQQDKTHISLSHIPITGNLALFYKDIRAKFKRYCVMVQVNENREPRARIANVHRILSRYPRKTKSKSPR